MMLRSRLVGLAFVIVSCGSGDDGGADTSGDGTTESADTMTGPTASASAGDDGDSTTAPVDTDTTTGNPDEDTTAASGDDTSTGTASCRGMTFFATSSGSGALGGNLGGLAGADAICQAHAARVGQGDCTWHAYLSTSEENARDRIGVGPWFNADGEMIAADVDALHDDGLSNGDPQHVLDEHGNVVPVSEHDILTGSEEDGTVRQGATCDDWTSDQGSDVGRVGHSDIPANPQFSPSWNSAHNSAGCTPQNLAQTGGSGRLYCFAID